MICFREAASDVSATTRRGASLQCYAMNWGPIRLLNKLNLADLA